ncbi:hypothetical protein NDU88_000352 [Pleurodeles waltl]|uniref:Uncharacterized protein n=1 Tax=Pleurodeles waltl TaxID=8319 RepID=A0AAV7L7W8_PLEWA|nr:hypothetical protein NDU88_000352 [Pleurodeles waltl]
MINLPGSKGRPTTCRLKNLRLPERGRLSASAITKPFYLCPPTQGLRASRESPGGFGSIQWAAPRLSWEPLGVICASPGGAQRKRNGRQRVRDASAVHRPAGAGYWQSMQREREGSAVHGPAGAGYWKGI